MARTRLVLIFLLPLLGGWLVNCAGEKQRAWYEERAERWRGEVVCGSWSGCYLRFTAKGVETRLSYSRPSENREPIITLTMLESLGCDLDITRTFNEDKIMPRFASWGVIRSVKLGEPDFDHEYLILTSDPDLAEKFLRQPPAREIIKSLLAQGWGPIRIGLSTVMVRTRVSDDGQTTPEKLDPIIEELGKLGALKPDSAPLTTPELWRRRLLIFWNRAASPLALLTMIFGFIFALIFVVFIMVRRQDRKKFGPLAREMGGEAVIRFFGMSYLHLTIDGVEVRVSRGGGGKSGPTYVQYLFVVPFTFDLRIHPQWKILSRRAVPARRPPSQPPEEAKSPDLRDDFSRLFSKLETWPEPEIHDPHFDKSFLVQTSDAVQTRIFLSDPVRREAMIDLFNEGFGEISISHEALAAKSYRPEDYDLPPLLLYTRLEPLRKLWKGTAAA